MIDYNFYPIIDSLAVLKDQYSHECSNLTNNARIGIVENIKSELNSFFNDFHCEEVIYTVNTDKPLFGLFVKPVWDPNAEYVLHSILGETEGAPFKSYKVEIDSKLLDMVTPAELCAIMINDINELCNRKSLEMIIDAINAVMAYNDETLNVKIISETFALFEFAIEMSLHNLTSALTKDSYACTVCSGFLKGYKLAPYFDSGIEKIYGSDTAVTALRVQNPVIVLNWYFMVYKDARTGRYVASILNKSLTMEGSTLVKKSAKRALESLTIVSDINAMYLDTITESVAKKRKGLIYQMKRNGLKSLEEDLYEYGMRLRNVDTQDDAILLMRQLNSRMSILEDYINYEDIDEDERQRWMAVYRKYQEIRAELSKKTVYNRKMYGLFVDYNALTQMDKSAQTQLLQSYF